MRSRSRSWPTDRRGAVMGKGRIEAFSDGVLAIIITIMVLEMKTPRDAELSALRPLAPVFLSYVLSFLYLGIYWSNHHHWHCDSAGVSASMDGGSTVCGGRPSVAGPGSPDR